MSSTRFATTLTMLVLAAALAAPGVHAHVEQGLPAYTLEVGPYRALFDTGRAPPFVGDSVTFSVLISEFRTNRYVTEAPVRLVVGGPGGENARLTLEPDGTGHHVASATFDTAGAYGARLLIENETSGEVHAAQTEFAVYPDLPLRILPADATTDPVVGRPATLAVEVVDAETGERTDALEDLDLVLERWSRDQQTMLASEVVPMRRAEPGVWQIEHAFEEAGAYRALFASESGNFTVREVPFLSFEVQPQVAEDDGGDNATSAPAVALVLATAILVASVRGRRE